MAMLNNQMVYIYIFGTWAIFCKLYPCWPSDLQPPFNPFLAGYKFIHIHTNIHTYIHTYRHIYIYIHIIYIYTHARSINHQSTISSQSCIRIFLLISIRERNIPFFSWRLHPQFSWWNQPFLLVTIFLENSPCLLENPNEMSVFKASFFFGQISMILFAGDSSWILYPQ
jgi:hypothetical protein